MKIKHPLLAAPFAAALLLPTPKLLAQDSGALLDALVQEGILKEKKAEEIRAKLARDFAKTPAGKIKLENSIKEIKISGDARFRYQWDEFRLQDGTTTGSKTDRNQQRERLRLRIGADAKLGDEFTVGFQLSTAQTADSDNQTVGATGAGAGFGKLPIFISRAYLGWEPVKGVGGVLGKQANPFYINDQGLVWDADINPVGLSEKLDFHKLLGWVGPWEVSLGAGQFTFADNNEGFGGGAYGSEKAKDAFLFQVQSVVAYKFDDANRLTFAPGFLTYNTASTLSSTGSITGANGAPFTADNGTRGLQLLLLPGDFSTKIAGLKTKFVWDFSYNLDGETRAFDVYGLTKPGATGRTPANSHEGADDYAWLLGVVFGENKKKGDVSFLANYRQTGLTAVDPNLNDSDFAQSRLNTRGFKLGVGYNLSNAVVLSLAYQNAFNLRHQLDSSGGWSTATLNNGANTTVKEIANRNNVQIFQADVSVKF